ncbi:NAD(P)H-quinone dehydrogenase [Lapillicoccus sp.]|uniref:NAD(P)H-quinone dehydrogenase n=1 Tax=Lapillicoccus sp. TaxID=1909287 RepID=UPI003982F57F
MIARTSSVVVLGGGPGGYEAALVAARMGATVTVVERDGLGGACVLTDCVPSKTLISTAAFMSNLSSGATLGVDLGAGTATADLTCVNRRILRLAGAQSDDIRARLDGDGVRILRGTGTLLGPGRVRADLEAGGSEELDADVVLVATGARPRVLPTAVPDGERILTWKQIYGLTEIPERLVVVGSGVTGAELAHAYVGLGAEVVLVSSRDRVLPGEDADAATVIEEVFRRDGMQVLNRSRMASVERVGDAVRVHLVDGRTVDGSHALLAVGSVPQTSAIGLQESGVQLSESGHIEVDGVSRTSVRGVYAAGDCTGVLPLASVAAMQGRIAVWHSLGDAVSPLALNVVSANIFTSPEIATVGISQHDIDEARVDARAVMLPLSTNPRAKMDSFEDGFVKVFSRQGAGTVLGGVVVAPRASELIFPVALAVQNHLTVDQLASTFTVYPSMSGSIAEAARRLH